jgi:hypothetical protein
MKSLEQQFVEIKSALLDKRLCVEADLKKFTEAETMEERLSGLKKYAATKGITESGRPRILRKNGSAIREADSIFTAEESRIENRMIRTGEDYRTAHCHITGSKPLPVGTKEPAKFTEARKERLKKAYKGVRISEQDFNAMAERRIEA